MSSGPHWGKRGRDDDAESFVRFRDLTPQQKLQRRRQERQEKKEQSRKLSYFQSMQRALEAQTSGVAAADPGALASLVEGFFVELTAQLRRDKTFHLLRNGTVCRAIEAALGSALLLQSKSLLYLFLGHLIELATSPVASYTLETLLVSLTQGLDALAPDTDELRAECTNEGPGMHSGSGVPSSATLIMHLASELAEAAAHLLHHPIGARALRSIVLVLGGFSIRQAPTAAAPVTFPDAIAIIAEAVVRVVEEEDNSNSNSAERPGASRETRVGAVEYGTSARSSAAQAWLAAARDPVMSLVLQSLLRVCEEGDRTDELVRRRLESLRSPCDSYKGDSGDGDDRTTEPLLVTCMKDSVGCHLFQAYIAVPAPAAVRAAGDRLALRAALPQGTTRKRAEAALLRALQEDEESEKGTAAKANEDVAQLAECCWARAMAMVQAALPELLQMGSTRVQATGYILQDLLLYAPSAAHVHWLWRDLLRPHLDEMLATAALLPVLLVLGRRCAFGQGPLKHSDELAQQQTSTYDTTETSGLTIPADLQAQLVKDEAQHVRFVEVGAHFQREVCETLCDAIAATSATTNVLHYLTLEGRLGPRGFELARYLLHFHATASRRVQQAVREWTRRDVVQLASHQKGSLVLQQLLRAAAMAGPETSHTSPLHGGVDATKSNKKKQKSSVGPNAAKHETLQEDLVRYVLQCLLDDVADLAQDRYGGYVLEVLYEVADMETKERLVQALVPVYQALKQSAMRGSGGKGYTNDTMTQPPLLNETDDNAEQHNNKSDPQTRQFVARKVLMRCCVEQYVHRPADWHRVAERQCKVQRLLQRMLAQI